MHRDSLRRRKSIPITTPSCRDSIESGPVTHPVTHIEHLCCLVLPVRRKAPNLPTTPPLYVPFTTPTTPPPTLQSAYISSRSFIKASNTAPLCPLDPLPPHPLFSKAGGGIPGPENEHPGRDVRSGTSAAYNTLPKISPRQR